MSFREADIKEAMTRTGLSREEAIDYLSDQCAPLSENTALISAGKKWGLPKLLELINHTLMQKVPLI